MATYEQITEYLKNIGVRGIKGCYIAHAKEKCGIPVRRSWRRTGKRMIPCPDSKFIYIQRAFRHFRML